MTTNEDRKPASFRVGMTNAFTVELANHRYLNDAEFHARVTLAERAAIQRLEAEGMRLTRPYRVAIRIAAMLGLYAAEVDVNG